MKRKKVAPIICAVFATTGFMHGHADSNPDGLSDYLSEINQEASRTMPYEGKTKAVNENSVKPRRQRSKEEILQRIRLTNGNAG